MLRVRLSDQEKQKLQKEADRKGISMSEVIRDYVKQLPDPPVGEGT